MSVNWGKELVKEELFEKLLSYMFRSYSNITVIGGDNTDTLGFLKEAVKKSPPYTHLSVREPEKVTRLTKKFSVLGVLQMFGKPVISPFEAKGRVDSSLYSLGEVSSQDDTDLMLRLSNVTATSVIFCHKSKDYTELKTIMTKQLQNSRMIASYEASEQAVEEFLDFSIHLNMSTSEDRPYIEKVSQHGVDIMIYDPTQSKLIPVNQINKRKLSNINGEDHVIYSNFLDKHWNNSKLVQAEVNSSVKVEESNKVLKSLNLF